MRVISLLPAATEIIAALDCADALVAVTHECDYPPDAVHGLPRVTRSNIFAVDESPGAIDAGVRTAAAAGASIFALDAERMTELRPDLIVTQALCDVCAVSETDVRYIAAQIPGAPSVLTLFGTTIEGVMQDITAVATALGVSTRGAALVQQLRARLDCVQQSISRAGRQPVRTAVIEWTDPVFAAGHWVPEMVRMAGGIDVLAAPGEHSRTFTVQDIAAAQPEVLFFSPCGYDLPRAEAEAQQTLAREEWRWARTLMVHALDANGMVSRPGPRIVDGVEIMAAALHPDVWNVRDHVDGGPGSQLQGSPQGYSGRLCG